MIRKVVKCIFIFGFMSIKEIKELEDEVKELDVVSVVEGDSSWEEKDFVGEDENSEEEEGEKEFSIGDTMLARGEEKEEWRAESLEDAVDWEEVEEFGDDEDLEGEGFSYEAAGAGGDLYGAAASGGDVYGVSSGGAGDLYGSASGGNSVSMYNTSSGESESSLYNTGATGGGKVQGISYDIGGPTAKKKGRGGKKSGLEMGVSKKRRLKGVSMY